MKKFIVSVLVVLMVIGCMTFVNAANEITVMIFEKKVEFDQEPIIEDGRTLVPLRAIFEALNAEVMWDGTTQTITAYKDTAFKETITVKLQIGSSEMIVSRTDADADKKVTLDVPAKILNGRTLVPVRAISEALDCEVEWIPKSYTIVITPFEADENVIVCYDLEGNFDSVVVEDYRGRVIKEVVYSTETGKFDYMQRFDYYGDETEVTVYNADGTIDSFSYGN